MELMVVIAIIGVVSAITLPALINPQNKSNKAARELMADIHKTRMGAIKSNQDWALVFDPVANAYYICSDPGADGVWSTVTGSNSVKKTIRFTGYAAGIRYGSGGSTTNANIGGGAFPADFVSYNSNVLTFNPRGTCPAGYVYISYGDASYAIGTLSTGLVRLKIWSNGAWR